MEPRIWKRLPKVEPTPEAAYLGRRQFLRRAGLAAAAVGVGGPLIGRGLLAQDKAAGDDSAALRPGVERPDVLAKFPAKRNDRFVLPGGVTQLTAAMVAATYNNFYEFTTEKQQVWRLAKDFKPDPWRVEVTGLCHKPQTFDIDDLFAIEQEERTYRFRCVEAWAMDVPWTGFELSRLLKRVEPKGDAKFVRFTTIDRPAEMPGIVTQPWYPWPYFEGLRMDEAMHELTLVATGLYGKPLPRQNGAPLRLIVPWKYGYKSPKSIVKIELLARQPKTFWETMQPNEYPFESNVNPKVPHPRWSQASERLIGTDERRDTLPFNGYHEFVAGLYR